MCAACKQKTAVQSVFFASQIYGAAVADNLDKNRGVLNRRYFRQVRMLSVFKVQVVLTATNTREKSTFDIQCIKIQLDSEA